MSARGGEPGDLGFDSVLGKLREVVERLESGNLSLEDSLAVYEEGVKLARRGHDLLDGAEKRVELLVSAAGGAQVVPFKEAEEGSGP
jgi:exodeoxyribonuclease VII small subunit